MNLEFLPSRTLTLYLMRLFLTRILAVLVMLVLVLQMLDLLGESGNILAHQGNGQAQLWTYVTLRVPQLVARFLPYSVLLATIITLATLNQNSEVIAMKASGLSAHQILAPLLLAAAMVSALSFAFNERIVTRASATLNAWQAVKYGPIPPTSDVRSNVYLRGRDGILLAATATGSGPAMTMTDVTWYRRDNAGMISEELRGPRAVYAGPGWRIDKPTRFAVGPTTTQALPPTIVARDITPAQIVINKVDADAQDILALSHSIAALKSADRRTSELEAAWWHKLSGPLAATLMPLLGAIAAFGLARSGQLLIRSIVGMLLGFAYFVVDNAALALGNFGGYSPIIAAWAPFVLFALIGETVLIRTEE